MKNKIIATICSFFASAAFAAPVPLQNATATLTQSGFSISKTIDGNLGGVGVVNGWAIDGGGGGALSETAVFETQTDVGGPGGALLAFTLTQNYGSAITLGKFRLSVTDDDRTKFADGLGTQGDVTANWQVLAPATAVASNGAILAIQSDNSVLASGPSPATTVYTITAATTANTITGIRLETLEDASLPSLGPGRAGNGNFVLQEFQVDFTPLPAPNANFDELGTVDAADLGRWLVNFGIGALHTEGDADNDSDVDGHDLLVWQRQLGTTPAVVAIAPVPEPSTTALCTSGLMLLCICIRRNLTARMLKSVVIALPAR